MAKTTCRFPGLEVYVNGSGFSAAMAKQSPSTIGKELKAFLLDPKSSESA